jgi:hypothetical protein
MKRLLKWAGLALLALLVLLVGPIFYVETLCRGGTVTQDYQPTIKDPAFQRKEANSYLTYPEWHIVYAYEGLAETLKTSDEHAFGYTSSVFGFWSSYCALNRVAGEHGGADWPTRRTIYVIGASFTFEMLMKALYEESIGHFTALLRGQTKTPQDEVSRDVAIEYAAFLNQTPWYKFDFEAASTKLWAAPISNTLRGFERRLGLGGEWWAKSKYAAMIGSAVEATGVAQLEIRSVVTGLAESDLTSIADVKIIGPTTNGFIIETPRYARFTTILNEIFDKGGKVIEIAGNDDVMLTAVGSNMGALPEGAELIADIPRDGFSDRRILLSTEVSQLHTLFVALKQGPLALEHVYDY